MPATAPAAPINKATGRHRVADVHYAVAEVAPSTSTCTCGATFEAPTAAGLARAFAEHSDRQPGPGMAAFEWSRVPQRVRHHSTGRGGTAIRYATRVLDPNDFDDDPLDDDDE